MRATYVAAIAYHRYREVERMGKLRKVAPGEHLVRIAADEKQRTYLPIWNHPANATIANAKGANPNILPVDAVITIDATPKEVMGKLEKRNRFVVKGKLVLDLDVVLLDETEKPIAGAECAFPKDGEKATSGGDGLLEKKDLPFGFELGVIRFDKASVDLSERGEAPVDVFQGNKTVRATYALAVGHLDPLTTITGVQARLNNLGYFAGELGYAIPPSANGGDSAGGQDPSQSGGGTDDPPAANAAPVDDSDWNALVLSVEEFELEHGLKPKGDPTDSAFLDKLQTVHGC